MNRRTFLKIAGISSLSVATGCDSQPDKTLYSLVRAPDDMVTGHSTWYASTCRECPAGCGILAKNREGRIIKLEGNPLNPINKGKLCPRGQAALQGVYNPDRIVSPLLKENGELKPIAFSDAVSIVTGRANQASGKGEGRIRLMTEMIGKSLETLFNQVLLNWRSPPSLIFEPYAFESLKSANAKVFGINGLPSYRMEKTDVLVSFGADFLETWLSPVEYAIKFKKMHAENHGKKGLFFHVAPYQGLTGANADRFLFCRPGGETVIASGLIRELIAAGRGKALPDAFLGPLEKAVSAYTQDRVTRLSGVSEKEYEQLIYYLRNAKSPLVLGSSTAGCGADTAGADAAAGCLNLILDPGLPLFDFKKRHAVERAAKRSEVIYAFSEMDSGKTDLLILYNVNPVFSLPSGYGVRELFERESLFVVSFSSFMDESASLADLVIPIPHSLETWDEYEGRLGIISTLQPTMGKVIPSSGAGDFLLQAALPKETSSRTYQTYLFEQLKERGIIRDETDWLEALKKGGVFQTQLQGDSAHDLKQMPLFSGQLKRIFESAAEPPSSGFSFAAVPSIRLYDGRGANKPWLCEIPDSLTQTAWETPLILSSKTAGDLGILPSEIIQVSSPWGQVEAPAYLSDIVMPDLVIMPIGQGHVAFGRYAGGFGADPVRILPPDVDINSGGPVYRIAPVQLKKTGRIIKISATDGSRTQHDRKIALSVQQNAAPGKKEKNGSGLSMNEFPFTLPLPEGYDSKRDIYPPHDHDRYRWGMAIDLDRCIGCGACAAACYAENNIGVTGRERIAEGREMAWLRIERYHDPADWTKVIFLPMLCQHCDNAPCEPVCPVYASHHSKEGLNNQIYNRCIGTRFCSQNCPYKVRRFNWFEWKWPAPLHLQLNPDVTVRSKGVMEKCSFCVQRIKAAHGKAKDENRMIRDGEVIPACAQTCPTDAFTFGNLMDPSAMVRKKTSDPRAYQVMGYLNTKPAVIYLRKVRWDL